MTFNWLFEQVPSLPCVQRIGFRSSRWQVWLLLWFCASPEQAHRNSFGRSGSPWNQQVCPVGRSLDRLTHSFWPGWRYGQPSGLPVSDTWSRSGHLFLGCWASTATPAAWRAHPVTPLACCADPGDPWTSWKTLDWCAGLLIPDTHLASLAGRGLTVPPARPEGVSESIQ